MMILILLILGIVMVVFPPAGLLLLGVFFYRLGTRWEKQQKKETVVQEVRMDEYNNQTLEQMK